MTEQHAFGNLDRLCTFVLSLCGDAPTNRSRSNGQAQKTRVAKVIRVFYFRIKLKPLDMIHPTKKPWTTEAQAMDEEYSYLRSKLQREDAFKTPQERTEAATRMKELRAKLNARYLASRGL